MPYLILYWLDEFLASQQNTTKALQLEMKTLAQIYEEMRKHFKDISRDLLEYLAEDLLLEKAVSNKFMPGTLKAQNIDPEPYLARQFTPFSHFLSDSYQQNITDPTPYKNGLRVLVRRYLIIVRLNEPDYTTLKETFGKGDLAGFLKRERANVEFLK